MKVVALCGSNRKKGNTAGLLEALEREFKKSDLPDLTFKKYNLPGLKIKPCRGCLKCKNKGYCILSDDYKKISARIIKSDLIILGSPVYFSDVSSPVKAFIDRTFSLWHKKELQGKKLIAVAACAESGSGHTIDTIKLWAHDHDMEFIMGIEGKGEHIEDVFNDGTVKDALKSAVELVSNSLSKST